jgi:DNA polymerase-3 subunit gamma/tau
VLAALQILDATRARLRGSAHGRLLVEMALVRIARLENLHDLGDLIARLTALEAGLPPPAGPAMTGGPGSLGGKKKSTSPAPASAPEKLSSLPATGTQSQGVDGTTLDLEQVRKLWPDLIKKVGVRIALPLSRMDLSTLACAGDHLLVIRVGSGYNWMVDQRDEPEVRQRIEKELGKLLGQPVTVRIEFSDDDDSSGGSQPGSRAPLSPPARPGDLNGDPMVQKVVQLFEARPVHLEVERGQEVAEEENNHEDAP